MLKFPTKILVKAAMFFLLWVWLFSISGCAGTTSNPAASPSPPIELPAPAVLKFVNYEGLKVDLGTIGAQGVAAQIVAGKEARLIQFTSGEDVSQYIRYGPNAFGQFVINFLQPTLGGIEKIGIPTHTATGGRTTRYTAAVDFGDVGVLSGEQTVTIDFGAFDLDGDGIVESYDANGDGIAEPCSGNAAQLPICIRLWLGDIPARFIAGVFEIPPTYPVGATVPSAIGKGRFRVFVERWNGYQSKIAYSYDDLAITESQKTIEYFFATEPAEGFSGGASDPLDVLSWSSHSMLTQVGSPETALKTLNMSDVIALQPDAMGNTTGSGDFQYIGRYIEGGNYWIGDLLSVSGISGGTIASDNRFEFGGEMKDVCAYIGPEDFDAHLTFGIVAFDPHACDSILLGDLAFVRAQEASDVAIPTDFPATPPIVP